MGKIWAEVSIISGRGLRRSSLFKLQWFAVGWIDPKNKYCTKIDASGSSSPQWRTKFATLIDSSGSGFGDLALHIEVYSREPIFLRESLHGTAKIYLKEFLLKHSKDGNSVAKEAIEEVGSYQLRKASSSKPQGFVDVSVRISEEREVPGSYLGNGGGIMLMDQNNINSTKYEEDSLPDSPHDPPRHLPIVTRTREDSLPDSPHEPPRHLPIVTRTRANRPQTEFPHGPTIRSNIGSSTGHIPNHQMARTPPPPPTPSNVGLVPTFLPRTENPNLAGYYMNMPPSRAPQGQSRRPRDFEMGLGAGALAAGAMIFGDDFMSGFDGPAGFQGGGVTVSVDPPF